MTFDWFFLSILVIFGVAAGMAVIAVYELARPEGTDESLQWRDPAPGLFRLMMPLARRYAQLVRLSDYRKQVLERRLSGAGLAFSILPGEFVALQWVFGLIGLLFGIYVTFLLNLSASEVTLVVIALPVAAYFYPLVWLRDAIKRREIQFEKQFPVLLELLGLSMRAGLTFSAALQQGCAQLPAGPVQQEFSRVIRDVRTGKSRKEALTRLSERVTLPAVSNFVAAIIQAEESGGSIGEVLANQAQQRRQERFARAEKQANEAPVKMLVPLVALLFPITFIIIAFPIVLEFMDSGAAGFLSG